MRAKEGPTAISDGRAVAATIRPASYAEKIDRIRIFPVCRAIKTLTRPATSVRIHPEGT